MIRKYINSQPTYPSNDTVVKRTHKGYHSTHNKGMTAKIEIPTNKIPKNPISNLQSQNSINTDIHEFQGKNYHIQDQFTIFIYSFHNVSE